MRRFSGLVIAFLILVACNLVGGTISTLLHLPVPGQVIGILLLLGGLAVHGRVPLLLRETAEFMIGHLNLFFIPAGVGVMAYVALVRQDLLPIVAALFGSTFLSLIVGALAFKWVAARTGRPMPDDEAVS